MKYKKRMTGREKITNDPKMTDVIKHMIRNT